MTSKVKALTTDVEQFFHHSDSEKDNLCLYGLPTEQWEVNLPAEEVPPELPEPALGINFARDGMQEKDWLSLVAVHSDAWLLAVAFFFGARFGFDRADSFADYYITTLLFPSPPPSCFICRICLSLELSDYILLNRDHGCESGKYSKLVDEEDKGLVEEDEGSVDEDEGLVEEDKEHGETLCGACGEIYASDEFWICCDICEKWFHGKCVKISLARADHIRQYKCPSCSNKRARPRYHWLG